MNRIWRALQGWATGGPERLAAQPLIAGYRRGVAPGWAMLAILALAIACFVYGFYFSVMAPARIMPFTVPLAILTGLVVWALPAGAKAPSKAIEPLLFAFTIALLIWPNYLAIALPSLPWMTMLRIIVVPLILVLLICMSVSVEFRRKLKDVLLTDRTLARLFIMLVALQTITMPLSADIGESINRYIIAQMNWTIIFIAAAIVFVRRGFAEHWTIALLVAMTILCALGIWESRLHHVPWAGNIPSIFRIEDPLVQRILAGASRAATKVYRVQGPSTTPLGFAELLGLAVPFAIHFALERYHTALRVLAALFLPLSVYVILLTDSRLGVVAALASVMIYLLIWGLIRWRQEPGGLIGPALVLTYPALFVGAVAATFFIGRIRNEVWGNGAQQASNDSRQVQWEMAIPKIFKNPIGHGIGQGGETLGFFNRAGVGTIDSYYLSILLEIGILGFVVYYGLMLRGAWIAARTVIDSPRDREIRLLIPLAVSLLNYVVVKSVLSQEANHPLAFIMLGASVALVYRATKLDAPALAAAIPAGRAARKADLGWLPLIGILGLASAATAATLVLIRGGL
ncbi:O-antigen ligase family protein [Phenylobacterium sp.]|uniref:O-antigen ligase family protein n=1 Tax=Phenylobacterium sp. TaxID=1871053 RepID=UPI002ED9340D